VNGSSGEEQACSRHPEQELPGLGA
jgi:hypothetical protein